ncbi:MAG: MFS transporter [Bacteroides sp.]|jgi:large-conductance mechanosensitive channel|nr:MFS transporter [Bacteroides sp.]MCI1682896.1 MFS transporter [Bacteroides sp.]
MKSSFSTEQRRVYNFLMILVIASTICLQGWRTLFNNFAVDNAGINGFQMGVIQSVREIPGFLTFLVIYLLLIFKEHRLSIYSVILAAIGVIFTGFFDSFLGCILTTFIFSTGFHYYETTNKSQTLQYFNVQQAPLVFGKQQSLKAITNICIGGILLLSAHFMTLKWNFVIIGVVVLLLVIPLLRFKPNKEEEGRQNTKMILKKKYTLFYILNFLSGARRQIFVVFAVFMLVEQYHFSVIQVTVLFILNNIITYFTAPLIGKGINRFGERTILSLEYSFMIFVFLGYGFIQNGWIIALLYVIDNLFFSCSIAINTFFQKVGEKADVASSMAVGFAINHISAVVIPVIGGYLWMLDYSIPYIVGAVLAGASLIFAQFIPKAIKKAQ